MPEINNTTSTNPTNKRIIQQTKLIHQRNTRQNTPGLTKPIKQPIFEVQAEQPNTTTPCRSIRLQSPAIISQEAINVLTNRVRNDTKQTQPQNLQ